MKKYFLLSLTLHVSLFAQDPNTFLRGEVSGSNTNDHLFVEVYERGRHMMLDRVPVLGDGRFEVHGVRSGGQYEVRVVRQNGDNLHSEDMVVNSPSAPLEIRLRQTSAAESAGGAVSLYRMQHQVPAQAASEFKKAEVAWKEGRTRESIERLEKALKLDPGYMEAHNNLGTKLLASGELARAMTEFRKAIDLDPASAPGHLNLAIGLLADPKDRDVAREAELHARKAMQLDPGSVCARYTLGIALSWLNKEEALPYLRETANRFPRARMAAANLLERLGRRQEARELRAQSLQGQ